MSEMLELRSVDGYIEGVRVLREVSIDLGRGETVAIVGRNGAGKTSTFRAVMGLLPRVEGSIRYQGEEITGLDTYERKRRGIGYAPEDRRLFSHLTARDNIQMSLWGVDDDHHIDVDEQFETILETFPKLKEFIDRDAGNLSGGEQQMTAIGRAMAADPELLLLDEPFEGLAPSIRKDLKAGIRRIQGRGVTVCVAESEINHVVDTADRIYGIERGEVVAEDDDPEHVLENEEMLRIIEG